MTGERPVLFLDVDGVLNRVGFRPTANAGLSSWIEPELAARLNRLVAASGAVVVMASSWREGRSLDVLRRELVAASVDVPLIDTTPVLPGLPRWAEIQAWLDTQQPPVARFVIVDDERDMGPLRDQHVRISSLVGLDDDACARALAVLGAD